jgi:serine/threonine protein kinase
MFCSFERVKISRSHQLKGLWMSVATRAERTSFGTIVEGFEMQQKLPGHAIWAAKDMRHNGSMVAVKILERDRCEDGGQAFRPVEVSLGTTLQHLNVVRILDVIQEPDRVILVQELLTGGDLFTCLEQVGLFSEFVARCCFGDLVAGLECLHVNGISHRNLKPENCVFDRDGTLKIIDFGLATRFVPWQSLEEYCGAPEFAAPEVQRNLPYQGPPVDVWAAGVMLYDMVLGGLPFTVEQDSFELPASLESEVSIELAVLLRGVLEQDPVLRFSVTAVQNSTWMALPAAIKSLQEGLMDGTLMPTTLSSFSPLCKRIQRERCRIIRHDMIVDYGEETNDDSIEGCVFLSV